LRSEIDKRVKVIDMTTITEKVLSKELDFDIESCTLDINKCSEKLIELTFGRYGHMGIFTSPTMVEDISVTVRNKVNTLEVFNGVMTLITAMDPDRGGINILDSLYIFDKEFILQKRYNITTLNQHDGIHPDELQFIALIATTLRILSLNNVIVKPKRRSNIVNGRRVHRRATKQVIRYHELFIKYQQNKTNKSNGVEKGEYHLPLELPFHTVSAHTRTYTEEKPLFGRPGLHGTFVIPEFTKGDPKFGESIRRFKVTKINETGN